MFLMNISSQELKVVDSERGKITVKPNETFTATQPIGMGYISNYRNLFKEVSTKDLESVVVGSKDPTPPQEPQTPEDPTPDADGDLNPEGDPEDPKDPEGDPEGTNDNDPAASTNPEEKLSYYQKKKLEAEQAKAAAANATA